MLNEDYFELLADTAELVTELGEHPEPRFADKVVRLLQQVDLVHREGLVRLIDALRARGAGDAIDHVKEDDPVVRVLLGLYGLADLHLPPESDGSTDGASEIPSGFVPIESVRVRRKTSHADAGGG